MFIQVEQRENIKFGSVTNAKKILLNIARRIRGRNDKYKRNNTIVNETLL